MRPRSQTLPARAHSRTPLHMTGGNIGAKVGATGESSFPVIPAEAGIQSRETRDGPRVESGGIPPHPLRQKLLNGWRHHVSLRGVK
jgi:hypothetical protein